MTAVPVRAPLSTEPWELPPPGPRWDEALDLGLRALGLDLDAGVRRALDAHTRLLLAWTAAINLTALRTPEAVARLHLVDSLSAVRLIRREAPEHPSLLDLGSGGGMPGLPLAAALPAGRAALVDSIGKKVRFLDVAARVVADTLAEARLPVPGIEAIAARAEDLAADARHREAWDVVTVRAVGSLAEAAELGLPLVAPAGILACWKRDDGSGRLADERAAAAALVRDLGGAPARVVADPEAALPGHRLVVVRKVRATPGRYPRPPAERRHAPDGQPGQAGATSSGARRHRPHPVGFGARSRR